MLTRLRGKVFLKQLEYYRGVLILTTNRVSNLDSAFESRIHLSLKYPPLEQEQRLLIWKTFTDSPRGSAELTGYDLGRLAQVKMNGRQIKNVVKIATLLASGAGRAVGMEDLERVLEIKGMGLSPSS